MLQVQSATEPPKKLAQGERALMADGGEYVVEELKTRGEPVEIANGALFLASDEAAFITGVCLAVDGGQSARVG